MPDDAFRNEGSYTCVYSSFGDERKLETMDTVKTETPPFWLIMGLVVLVIIGAACIFSFCGK